MVENIEYTYYKSGLSRHCFIDAINKKVVKIPNKNHLLGLKHSFLEYQCYQEAPPEVQRYITKTELLDNGIIKQTFVKVEKSNVGFVREVGRCLQTNELRIFDTDIFFGSDYKKPEAGFDYEKLLEFSELRKDKSLVKKLKNLNHF